MRINIVFHLNMEKKMCSKIPFKDSKIGDQNIEQIENRLWFQNYFLVFYHGRS